jgi:hypothetical protein
MLEAVYRAADRIFSDCTRDAGVIEVARPQCPARSRERIWSALKTYGGGGHVVTMKRRSALLLAGFLVFLSLRAVKTQDPTSTTIDFPGAIITHVLGINPRGDIVGGYLSADLRPEPPLPD